MTTMAANEIKDPRRAAIAAAALRHAHNVAFNEICSTGIDLAFYFRADLILRDLADSLGEYALEECEYTVNWVNVVVPKFENSLVAFHSLYETAGQGACLNALDEVIEALGLFDE